MSPSPDGRVRSNLLRERSEQAVLEVVFREGPITRPEIAARTNLSKPTVSAVVGRLEKADLVHATGERHGRRGRKPMAYVVSDRAGFVVGVDVGGANLRAGAADLYGELICERQEPTSTGGARAVGRQMLEMVNDVVRSAEPRHQRLLAVGISTPGVVDQRTRVVTSLAYNVSPDGGFDPLGVISRRYDVPVLLDNNINLAAVGEKWSGLAQRVSTFAYVSIGAGVGMGVVIDDEVVRGAHGAAGAGGRDGGRRDRCRLARRGRSRAQLRRGGLRARARRSRGRPADRRRSGASHRRRHRDRLRGDRPRARRAR